MERIEIHAGTGDRLIDLLYLVQVRQTWEIGVIITETPADLVSFLIGYYQESTKTRGS